MEIIDSFPGYKIRISHISDGDMRDQELSREIIRPYPQDHATEIGEYTGIESDFSHRDGIYTEIPDASIGAICADCPILIFMGEGEIAAVHSGWRGTKAHIVRHALEHFKKTEPKDLRVFIGPHIQKASYEVQSDFLEHFPRAYFLSKKGKWYFDIEKYLMDDLLVIGIRPENIYTHGGDTFSDAKYFSYRRDGMVGVGCVSVELVSI